MSPYAAANGSAPRTAARPQSVRSARPRARASTSSPAPASAKRTPAPSSGGVSSSPSLIATQVLDQMATSSAYSDQTTGRLIGRTSLAAAGSVPARANRDTSQAAMTDLDRAVQTVVRRCLAVQPGEDVVVVVDEPLQELGERLRAVAQAAGAE